MYRIPSALGTHKIGRPDMVCTLKWHLHAKMCMRMPKPTNRNYMLHRFLAEPNKSACTAKEGRHVTDYKSFF